MWTFNANGSNFQDRTRGSVRAPLNLHLSGSILLSARLLTIWFFTSFVQSEELHKATSETIPL